MRSRLLGQVLLLLISLVPSELFCRWPWPLDAATPGLQGWMGFVYRPGGRYFIYRPRRGAWDPSDLQLAVEIDGRGDPIGRLVVVRHGLNRRALMSLRGVAAAPAPAAPSQGMSSAPPLKSPTDNPFAAVAGPRRRITDY